MTGQIFLAADPNVQQLPIPRRGPRLRISDADIIAGFTAGKTDEELAYGVPGVDASYIFRRRMKLRLLRQRGGKRGIRNQKESKAQQRHGSHTLAGRPASLPAVDNPALSEARTIYPSTVVPVEGLNNVLISGVNSKKIGSHITKGPAKGFPIFTLTLEERATCPTSCHHWRSCYGNNLHLAKRIQHGKAFEWRLENELAVLQSRYPGGFAVRLHVLGDFYSVEYVQLWARFLKQFRSLMVFGFTARWDWSDPIAAN